MIAVQIERERKVVEKRKKKKSERGRVIQRGWTK